MGSSFILLNTVTCAQRLRVIVCGPGTGLCSGKVHIGADTVDDVF